MPDTGTNSGSNSSPQSWSSWSAENQSGAPLTLGSVIRERFVLEELVGTGGMGQVFRALDRRREEAQDRHPYVAIKVLSGEFRHHPDALRTLQREARKAQKLAHPNIGSVFDFDRDGANVYLVMELLHGKPLNEVVKAHLGTGLGLERALPLIEELGIALSHAHSRGIVHADFKPSNVFLTDDGEVKVIDFGIARAGRTRVGVDDATQTVFDPGKLGAATLAYASPEQLLSTAEPDARDDVYSLGVVAYELLGGKHPYERRSALEAQLQEMKVKPLPVLTDAQNEALRCALSFRREMRPASVNDFVVALGLNPVVRHLATTSTRPLSSDELTRVSSVARPQGGGRNRVTVIAIGIGIALLVATAVGVNLYREQQAQALEQQRVAQNRLEQERVAREASDRARRAAEVRAAAEAEARARVERERVAAVAQAETERLARERADQEKAATRRAAKNREAAVGAGTGTGRRGLIAGTFYRWHDDSGEVHYGTDVPPEYISRAVPVAPAN